ncbi:transposase, partial [Rhodopseudomonas palustris]|uniref:transposase n=1 Tax=Rhodopseudomonas palustris TaxID=1076 RepID=UPI0012D47F7A
GYLNEVRSSRRLERECRRNVELMWLVRRLSPDFKTIADFRRDNGPAIVGASRAYHSDAREGDDAPGATAAALAALDARRAELDRLAAQLDDSQRNTVVEGEPDARPMGYGKGPKPPSYNLQTAVDADTGLILHHEVTTEPTDNRLLHPMAKATKDTLGVVSLTVVADAGYSNGAGAAACENDGITPCAPANRSVNNQGDGTLFDRSTFVYQPDTDTYACPGERVLVRKQIMRRDNCVLYAAQDCSGCAFKTRCTTAARRFLTRHLHDDALARMNARVVADPGLMRQRRCAAEHPFGTIKRMTAGDDSSPGAAKRSA